MLKVGGKKEDSSILWEYRIAGREYKIYKICLKIDDQNDWPLTKLCMFWNEALQRHRAQRYNS